MASYTLAELEAQLAAAEAINDFEAVACIQNDIADLKGEPRPYDQEWFEDLQSLGIRPWYTALQYTKLNYGY